MLRSTKCSPSLAKPADHGAPSRTSVRPGRSVARLTFLAAAFSGAAFLASAPSIAATLTLDLSGVTRSTPAVTMGALAVSDQLAVPVAPTGLSLQISAE